MPVSQTITEESIQSNKRLDATQKNTPQMAEVNPEPFSIRLVDSDAGFDSLREAWNEVSTTPLRGFVWHRQWWKEFGNDAKLRIYCLELQGETVGIAPFFERRWLGQSALRFIGSGKVCTDYPGLIVAPQFHQLFVEALRDQMKLDDALDVIEMEGVDRRGPGEIFKSEFSSDFWSYEKVIDACWFLKLPQTWDEFVKGSPRSLRRKIRKAEKRLAAGEVSIESTDGDLDFEDAFDTLVELHQLRFESKGEPGVFADPKFLCFLKTVTRELCGRGRAEINISTVDGNPLAAQLYLLDDSGPQFYQGGLRIDRMDLEPGHLMFTYAVKKAVERGNDEFDFLRGNEPYKAFWGATQRPLSTVRLVSRRSKPTLTNYAYLAARATKHLLLKQLQRFR